MFVIEVWHGSSTGIVNTHLAPTLYQALFWGWEKTNNEHIYVNIKWGSDKYQEEKMETRMEWQGLLLLLDWSRKDSLKTRDLDRGLNEISASHVTIWPKSIPSWHPVWHRNKISVDALLLSWGFLFLLKLSNVIHYYTQVSWTS